MRGRIIILPLLLIVLAACTRQAEGPFEPIEGENATSVGVVASPTPAEVVITEEAGITDEFITETTDPGITEDVPPIFTIAPTETPTEESIPFDFPTETPSDEIVDSTPDDTFITPGSPNDLMLGATNTPTEGATSDLLPSPTSMVDENGNVDDETPSDDEVHEDCIYIVQRGDSLYRIALSQDTTVAALREANEEVRETDVIYSGQELIIPDCDAEPTEEPEPSATFPADVQTHTVAAGESLYLIALRYGVTMQAIIDANDLENPDRLSIGQVLIIPPQ